MSTHKLTHSGNILLIGFGGMLIMMSVLVYLSVKQEIPMVSKNYYEQELVYQQRLDAMNNTNTYDRQFHIAQEDNIINLQLPTELSRNISEGTVYFYCPAQESMDRQVPLPAQADGKYTFDRHNLPGAAYVVKISFRANGRDYYKELKLNRP